MDQLARLTAALADRYAIEREIGAGGMATVYLARDLKHDRRVAIKVLRPEVAEAVGGERFLQEIKTTAGLQHPHILPLFDSGQVRAAGGPGEDPRTFLFFVMPYVEGESLRARLARQGAMPLAEGVRLLRDVADALAHAHARGFVHRDVKPDNVMLSGRHALVTDFGVARAVTEAGGGAAALTTIGVAVGTPAYMAPEQATADPGVDHRADLYAFGVLAYEVLAGAPPFRHTSPHLVIAAHLTEEPTPLARVRPEVGAALNEIVMRCLAKDPAARWAGAEEIVRRLEAVAASLGRGSVPRPTLRPGRARVWATVGAIAVVALGVGVVLRGPGTADAVSPEAVAVFPFTVRGNADLGYLREGMVNLLATGMDGAGQLRSVDPRAVMARLHQEGVEERVPPEQAARIAEALGAGLFVLGDIVQAGDRVRIDAALYDRRRGLEPVGRGSVDGSPGDLLPLVDRVTAQLLASGPQGAGSRVTAIAAVTTSSLPALKRYLEGEDAFREGRFDLAVEAFQAAVAADSTFALAFYRLSVAAEWAQRPILAEEAAEGAVRHADRLSDHDRRLLQALLAARRGDDREAESEFQAILSIWPQDVEAWFQLGEVQFHYSPIRGQPFQRSADAFQRVLAIEPDHAVSLIHTIRIASTAHDTAAVDSIGEHLARLIPESDRMLETQMFRALVSPDPARVAQVQAQLQRVPEVLVPLATWSAATWTDDFAEVRSFMEALTRPNRSDAGRMLGHLQLAHVEGLQGRWRAARRELAAAEAAGPAMGLEFRALLTLQAIPWTTRAEIVALRDELLAWDAARTPPSPVPQGPYAAHDGLHVGLRHYLVGLAQARLGEHSAALANAAALDRLPGTASTRRVYGGLAAGVRSAVLASRGDVAGAARALEPVERIGNYEAAILSSFRSHAGDRYRRAVLLDSLGQSAAAARLYGTFEGFNLFDRVHAGPAHLRAARLAEREGRRDDAQRHYERFLFLWADADPEARPMLEEARAGIARLGR